MKISDFLRLRITSENKQFEAIKNIRFYDDRNNLLVGKGTSSVHAFCEAFFDYVYRNYSSARGAEKLVKSNRKKYTKLNGSESLLLVQRILNEICEEYAITNYNITCEVENPKKTASSTVTQKIQGSIPEKAGDNLKKEQSKSAGQSQNGTAVQDQKTEAAETAKLKTLSSELERMQSSDKDAQSQDKQPIKTPTQEKQPVKTQTQVEQPVKAQLQDNQPVKAQPQDNQPPKAQPVILEQEYAGLEEAYIHPIVKDDEIKDNTAPEVQAVSREQQDINGLANAEIKVESGNAVSDAREQGAQEAETQVKENPSSELREGVAQGKDAQNKPSSDQPQKFKDKKHGKKQNIQDPRMKPGKGYKPFKPNENFKEAAKFQKADNNKKSNLNIDEIPCIAVIEEIKVPTMEEVPFIGIPEDNSVPSMDAVPYVGIDENASGKDISEIPYVGIEDGEAGKPIPDVPYLGAELTEAGMPIPDVPFIGAGDFYSPDESTVQAAKKEEIQNAQIVQAIQAQAAQMEEQAETSFEDIDEAAVGSKAGYEEVSEDIKVSGLDQDLAGVQVQSAKAIETEVPVSALGNEIADSVQQAAQINIEAPKVQEDALQAKAMTSQAQNVASHVQNVTGQVQASASQNVALQKQTAASQAAQPQAQTTAPQVQVIAPQAQTMAPQMQVTPSKTSVPQAAESQAKVSAPQSQQIRKVNKPIVAKDIRQIVSSAVMKHRQVVFCGPSGTGKTYQVRKYARRNTKGYDGYKFVQFHPSFEYSDLIEGLRPVNIINTPNATNVRIDGVFKAFCRRIVEDNLEHAVKGFSSLYAEKKQKVVQDFFEKIRDKKEALEDGTDYKDFDLDSPEYVFEHGVRDYYFIIDEINRADVAAVFGDVQFALDEDYRGIENRFDTRLGNLKTYRIIQADDIGKTNYNSTNIGFAEQMKFDCFERGFFIPHNLRIIATMNNLNSTRNDMDVSFRQKFRWVNIKPAEIMRSSLREMLKDKNVDWVDQFASNLNLVNNLISEGLSEEYCLGPAFFRKLDAYPESIDEVFESDVEPVLKEYLAGKPDDIYEMFVSQCRKALKIGIE